MNFETLNGKLEAALDIIMEHFSETEDRISALEDQVEALRNELEDTRGQR